MRKIVSKTLMGLFCGSLLLTGCAGGSGVEFPDTVSFKGTVTMDGQPLANHLIVFTPVDTQAPGAFDAMAFTDANGGYDLKTVRGGEEKPGAVPGEYTVRVSSMVPKPTVDQDGKEVANPGMGMLLENIPDQYSNPAKTTLKATVGASGGTQDFELKSK